MPIIRTPSMYVIKGTTTAVGTNVTLIDNLRAEATNHWNGQLLLITSGINAGQVREIVTWNLPAFTFTVAPAFEAPVIAAVTYKVLSNLAADIDITAIAASVAVAAAYAIVNSGLGFRGTVSAAAPPNFTIPTLIGLGVGIFVDTAAPYWAFVLRNADAAGGAPQGEMQRVTAYVSATGVFTTDPFTVAVAAGDDIIILNSRLVSKMIPTSGVLAKVDDLLEQNAFVITPTRPIIFKMGFLDLVNLTQTTTIRVYVRIDGGTDRIVDQISWTTVHPDGLSIAELTVAAGQLITVSVQSAVLEGAARNIPWSHILEAKS